MQPPKTNGLLWVEIGGSKEDEAPTSDESMSLDSYLPTSGIPKPLNGSDEFQKSFIIAKSTDLVG